ncbi:MAG: hypothetical protein MHPSP_002964 [Paramarteilia canceri]
MTKSQDFCRDDLPKLIEEAGSVISFYWTNEFCDHILNKKVYEDSKYVSSGQACDSYENFKEFLKHIQRFDTERILQILFLIFISYYLITFFCGICYMIYFALTFLYITDLIGYVVKNLKKKFFRGQSELPSKGMIYDPIRYNHYTHLMSSDSSLIAFKSSQIDKAQPSQDSDE